MRITSSEIQLSAQHAAEYSYSRRETLVEGVTGESGVFEPGTLRNERQLERNSEQTAPLREGGSLLDSFTPSQNVLAALSVTESALDGLQELLDKIRTETLDLSKFAPTLFDIDRLGGVEGVDADALEATPEDQLRRDLIVSVIEEFTGKHIQLIEPEAFLKARRQAEAYAAGEGQRLAQASAESSVSDGEQPRAGEYGFIYRLEEQEYQSERTDFQARGIVQTVDGEEIAIDISMSMSREFLRSQEVEVRGGAALKDPLVVNFSGTAAELSARTFSFDIDSDGAEDQIRFTGANGGFLALDRNGDGTINNGSELFGARSGDGFAELSQFDEDGNGFIDEGDSVYDGLRVFSRDDSGNDRLVALGERGIGAIYLGHTETPFDVVNEQNELEAVVRQSGIYLREDGSAGTVQQVDLVA